MRAISHCAALLDAPQRGLQRCSQALTGTTDYFEAGTTRAGWGRAVGAQMALRWAARLTGGTQPLPGRLDAPLSASAVAAGAAAGGCLGPQAARLGADVGAVCAIPARMLLGSLNLVCSGATLGAVSLGAALGAGCGLLGLLKPKYRPLTSLPDDVLRNIVAHADTASLATLSQTSRSLHELADAPLMERELEPLEDAIVNNQPVALHDRLSRLSAEARELFLQKDLGGGLRPLALAAARGHARVVDTLLAVGADPRHQDAVGWAAADWAALRGFPMPQLPLATRAGQQPPVVASTPLRGPRAPQWVHALFTGNPEILRWHVRTANVNERMGSPDMWLTGGYALLTAPSGYISAAAQPLLLQALLERGLDLAAPASYENSTLLAVAADSAGRGLPEHSRLVELLLSHGARRLGGEEPENLGQELARRLGRIFDLPKRLIVRLADLGADFSQDFWWETVLDPDHNDSARSVRALLQHGAQVNQRWHIDSLTALHMAARHGKDEVLHILARAGADLNARAPSGWVPLVEACRSDDQGRSLRKLVALGADVTAVDGAGMNLLHHAAVGKHAVERVPELLRILGHRARPMLRAQTLNGHTPLHALAESEDSRAWAALARQLVEAGADPRARTLSPRAAKTLSWPRGQPRFEDGPARTAAEQAVERWRPPAERAAFAAAMRQFEGTAR